MRNPKALWLAKHWGLGLGIVLSIGGLGAAAPGYMVSWRVSERKDEVFGSKLTSTAYTRIGERLPLGFKTVSLIPDSHELKGLGVSAMLLGSTLMLACSVSLKKEYERLEKANWMVRQSEFALADHEYLLMTDLDQYDTQKRLELDKWRIDLDTQTQISSMIQPPKSYYANEQQDQPLPKPEPEFSRSTAGFLAWLQQEKFAQLGLRFEVRWCCQQSFPVQKLKASEVRAFVDELEHIEQAEWLDEAKNQFRLLLN